MTIILLLEIALLSLVSFIFLYQAVFVLASLLNKKGQPQNLSSPSHRIAVLIPAHNEEILISRCLRSVLLADYPEVLRDIYVIADNCTDQTVEKATLFAVTCLQRDDLKNPGKGYAIQWAMDRIQLSTYDAVLFLDADAVVSPNIFVEIDRSLSRGEKAIQVYNGTLNSRENWLTRCSHFSDVFQFLLYFEGREVLGLTSRLLGNGMCLHREVLTKVRWSAFSITENWEYYFNVQSAGYRIAFTPSAYANSDQIVSFSQGKAQKRRWQAGWTEAAKKYLPRMISQAWKEKSVRLADAVVDFVLPSASMQAGLLVIAVTGGMFIQNGLVQYWSLVLGVCGATGAGVCLVVGGAGYRDYLAICFGPLYIVWKVVLRLSLALHGGPEEWVRTTRS